MIKPRIKETIIVEGRYDKIKLSGCVSANIIETGGFHIFSDSEFLRMIRMLAKSGGVIIMTDSDSAGFIIRNYLKGAIFEGTVKHAYIPDVSGRERRKKTDSKEGKLGVEGINFEILIEALSRAGATFEYKTENKNSDTKRDKFTKYDLYRYGYSGKEGSATKRKMLLEYLQLPEMLSASAMVDVINVLYTYDEAIYLIKQFSQQFQKI